jgi:hypothetical protein
MKSIAILAALLGIALALPAPVANPPSPMLPGARASCDQYFLASPGVSCWSMATEHGLTIDEFVRINPQVPSAGGCEGGGIQPHFWYCVKDGPGPDQDAISQAIADKGRYHSAGSASCTRAYAQARALLRG